VLDEAWVSLADMVSCWVKLGGIRDKCSTRISFGSIFIYFYFVGSESSVLLGSRGKALPFQSFSGFKWHFQHQLLIFQLFKG
jgi:hypothetical protein